MVMSDIIQSTGTNESRLVTVADLRYELERERELTNAQFREFGAKLDGVNQSVELLRGTVDERFGLVNQRFKQVDQKMDDHRAETLRRFDQIDKRFDALDVRLRSNKTLTMMSLTAAASIASVVISLLK